MKTAERILLTSLELFNHNGESNVSCVDIAIELDISPGNLYYHYKGKEVIVSALFAMYQERINKILRAPEKTALSLEEFFYFMTMLFESIHLFRFLYHNPADMMLKYPSLAKGFSRILKAKEACLQHTLSSYVKSGDMNISDHGVQTLTGLLSMFFTQAHNHSVLRGEDSDSDKYIFQILSSVLFLLTPYLNIEQATMQKLIRDINQASV